MPGRRSNALWKNVPNRRLPINICDCQYVAGDISAPDCHPASRAWLILPSGGDDLHLNDDFSCGNDAIRRGRHFYKCRRITVNKPSTSPRASKVGKRFRAVVLQGLAVNPARRMSPLLWLLVAVVAWNCQTPRTLRADAADDLAAGRIAMTRGDLTEALPHLAAAAEALPQSVEAQLALAECHLKLGRLPEALSQYRKVLKLSPEHALARQVVAALSGQDQTFDERLAHAQTLMDVGALDAAERVLVAAIKEPVSKERRHAADLLLAEVRLWNGNTTAALSEALRLVEESSDAAVMRIAKIIAALALIGDTDSDALKKQAVSLLPAEMERNEAEKLSASWNARAEFVRQWAALDAQTATAFSARFSGWLREMPQGNWRNQRLELVWTRIIDFASQKLDRGEANNALAILWPMVADSPVPGDEAVGKPIQATGGWLEQAIQPAQVVGPKGVYQQSAVRIPSPGGSIREVALMMEKAAAQEVIAAGSKAQLRGAWLAAETLRNWAPRIESLRDERLALAERLAQWSRPPADRKSGTPLSQADELQRLILIDMAGNPLNAAQQETLILQVLAQVQRYDAADDLPAGLARFVTVGAEPFEAALIQGLDKLPRGDARQKLLRGLADSYTALGAKAFQEAAASLAATANQTLQSEDRIALRLYGQAREEALVAAQHQLAQLAVTGGSAVIQRYESADRWDAALAGVELLHAGVDLLDGRFVKVTLQLRQALREEDRLLAANRGLAKELSPRIRQILVESAAIVAARGDDASRQTLLDMASLLMGRYASLERFDLATSVIDVLTQDEPLGKTLADWRLWASASLEMRQGSQALELAAQRFRGDQGLPLLEQHRSAIRLFDSLLSDHPTSPYFGEAVERYLAIAAAYRSHGSYDTAQAVLTAFLDEHAELTAAERVHFELVQTLRAKAQADFDEQLSNRKIVSPPTALTPAHAATLNALAAFLKQHPQGDYTAAAEEMYFQIGALYGRHGAWPVVRTVLDQYATAFPALRAPEHLKLLEAATYLGELDREYGLSLLRPAARPQLATALEEWIERHRALANFERTPANELTTVDATLFGDRWKDDRNGDSRGGGFGYSIELPAADPFGESKPAVPTTSKPTPDVAGVSGRDGRNFNAPDSTAGMSPLPTQPGSSYNGPPIDSSALAAIRQSQQRQSQQIALLDQPMIQGVQEEVNVAQSLTLPSGALLSEAELARQDASTEKAYEILIELAKASTSAQVSYAQQARAQILWLVGFFEGQQRPQRAAAWIARYLSDRPDDPERVALAYRALEDRLAFAALPDSPPRTAVQLDQAWFESRHARFEEARAAFETFMADFDDEQTWVDQARLLKVSSYEREAELARSFSAVRAGGLYVQAAAALLALLEAAPHHPQAGSFPSRLWNLAEQLENLSQQDQAIYVLSQIPHRFPTDGLAAQAVFRIAHLHAIGLHNPLKAVETYQEYLSLNGDDENVRSQIFLIAQQLAAGQRYLEALHVFGVFVDSFPNDPRAAEALRQIGQVHHANEAWNEAMTAYQRIMAEYPGAEIIPQVKLAIAECHINLSGWRDARRLYEDFLEQFPQDGQSAMARARIDILKNLERYQTLLADQNVQRNKDDAQFQIGRIVREQLQNPVKAVEEFEKVVSGYPQSDLADDAQLEIGRALLDLGRLDDARTALLEVPQKHPDSPLADDALYLVAQSYEQQAARLAAVTVAQVRSEAYEQGQKGAYQDFNRQQALLLEQQRGRRTELKKTGKAEELALDEAVNASRLNLTAENIFSSSRNAEVLAESEMALQVANRQDRINDALREAVELYGRVVKEHPLGDKTDDSLLRIAVIFETELKDRTAAMETYQKIVKLFPGTPVAEDAAWKVAKFYEQEGKFSAAVDALRDFIRNYPASQRVAEAQFSLAEVYEQLGRWVDAMDAYETFRQKFGQHPKAQVAQEQINWIKAYRK